MIHGAGNFRNAPDIILDNIRIEMYDKIRNPIQWNIAAAICRFQLSFWGTNENYLNAPLFENVCFLKAAPRRGA